MKPLFISLQMLIFLGCFTFSEAQEKTQNTNQHLQTDTITVQGNCGMCKARIEAAAQSGGSFISEWNLSSKILKVTFNPTESSMGKISKKIASAGHYTSKDKADDNAYNALPSCCKYPRKSQVGK